MRIMAHRAAFVADWLFVLEFGAHKADLPSFLWPAIPTRTF